MMQLSDNLLAAFLDGHASADEAMEVLDCARRNPGLQRFFTLSEQVDSDLSREPAPQRLSPRDLAALRMGDTCRNSLSHKPRLPKK